MKIAIWITSLIAISTLGFSQETNQLTVVKDKHYYQKERIEHLVLGSVLLGAGITALAIASNGHTDLDALPLLVITGAAASVGGIALLISSANSKKKARSMNAFLKMETAPIQRQCSLVHQYFPSLTIEIRF